MKAIAVGLVAAFLAAAPSVATPIVLTFDQLNGSLNESPLNYYAGGFGSEGTGPGPDYGITFSANTITGVEQPDPNANTNSAGSPSAPNIIFFTSGNAATMDVASGFTTGFSFYYSSANDPASVNVYSGLDDTGTLLATLNFPATGSGSGTSGCYGTDFCPYSTAGVTFSGVARSVDFGGSENQVAFDNITLGSATAMTSSVPETATWLMMILGFGAIGGVMRSAHRKSEEKFTRKVRSLATA